MYEAKRDVILFCIDCSESMLKLYDDSKYEGVQTCHLYTALEAAMQIQKKKIIVGPNDSFGILLFNTVRFGLFIQLSSDSNVNVGPEDKKIRNHTATRVRNQEKYLPIPTYHSSQRPEGSRTYATPRRFVLLFCWAFVTKIA